MRELTPELIVDGTAPRRPVVSPDGCRVAFEAVPVGRRGEHSSGALWVAPDDERGRPDRLWLPDPTAAGCVWWTASATGTWPS